MKLFFISLTFILSASVFSNDYFNNCKTYSNGRNFINYSEVFNSKGNIVGIIQANNDRYNRNTFQVFGSFQNQLNIQRSGLVERVFESCSNTGEFDKITCQNSVCTCDLLNGVECGLLMMYCSILEGDYSGNTCDFSAYPSSNN